MRRWRITCYRGTHLRWLVEIHRAGLCVVSVESRAGLREALLIARWVLWCRSPRTRKRMSERSIEFRSGAAKRRPRADRVQLFEAWAANRRF